MRSERARWSLRSAVIPLLALGVLGGAGCGHSSAGRDAADVDLPTDGSPAGSAGIDAEHRLPDAREVASPVLADAAAGPDPDVAGADADSRSDTDDGRSTDGVAGVPEGPVAVPPPSGAHYEVRVAASMVPADGYSLIPVLVVGTRADGAPALDTLTLSLNRPDGGTLMNTEVKLTAVGGSTFFVPCSYVDPGCLGPVWVQAELAQAPGTIVAVSTRISVTKPDGVGSPAACLGAQDVMFLDGEDFILKGVMTVTAAVFTASSSTRSHVRVMVAPIDSERQGDLWTLDFSSQMLGQDLRPQIYQGAQRYPFEAPARPGMAISGDHRGCSVVLGDFQIHTVVWAGNQLNEFLATFDQHCDAGLQSTKGCIHYTRP